MLKVGKKKERRKSSCPPQQNVLHSAGGHLRSSPYSEVEAGKLYLLLPVKFFWSTLWALSHFGFVIKMDCMLQNTNKKKRKKENSSFHFSLYPLYLVHCYTLEKLGAKHLSRFRFNIFHKTNSNSSMFQKAHTVGFSYQ